MAISGLVLFPVFHSISWKEVYNQIKSANLTLIAIGATLNFITVGARAARWHILLRRIKPTGFGRVFRSYMGGLAVNSVMPFRLGEAYRAHSVSSTTGTSITMVASTILTDRSFDAISFGLIVMLAACFLALPMGLASKAYGTAFASMALIATFPIVSIIKKSITRSNCFSGSRIPVWLESILRSYGCMSALQAVWCALLSLLSWIAQIAVASIVCHAVGLKIALGGAALVVIAINLAMALPVTPAAIGVFQAAFLLAATAYGFDKQIAMAAAMILQTTLVVPVLVVGVSVLNRDLLRYSNQSLIATVRHSDCQSARPFDQLRHWQQKI